MPSLSIPENPGSWGTQTAPGIFSTSEAPFRNCTLTYSKITSAKKPSISFVFLVTASQYTGNHLMLGRCLIGSFIFFTGYKQTEGWLVNY